MGDDAKGILSDDPMGKASELDPTKRAGIVS
jgi:hypothetical protein